MKTKITTILLAGMFFLSTSAFSDGNKPPKANILSACGCGDDYIDKKDVYSIQNWWIGPAESMPYSK